MAENIHPIFDSILKRTQREKLLGQKALVIWLVGLSGSGKSTIARALENALHEDGYLTMLLDGDNLRVGLNSNLGFSEADRQENIRRTAEVARLIADCGVITICSFITPTNELRRMSAEIIGESYHEVFVNCPIEVCEDRDVKGIYAKARNGEIKNFTGIDAPFESPQSPFLELKTDELTLQESVKRLFDKIIPLVKN